MTTAVPTCINLVVEDALSESVSRRIIETQTSHLSVGVCYGKMGYGYVKRNVRGFHRAAVGIPHFVLVDLEEECAPLLVQDWLGVPPSAGFLFRVAVREVESWLLADTEGMAKFLSVPLSAMPRSSPDDLPDPKRYVVNLARRSRKHEIRHALVPKPDSTAGVGPEYNSMLCDFAERTWNVDSAAQRSDSLRRAVLQIRTYDSGLS